MGGGGGGGGGIGCSCFVSEKSKKFGDMDILFCLKPSERCRGSLFWVEKDIFRD